MKRSVAWIVLLAGGIAFADAGSAKKLNSEGMALYKKKDYSRALEKFDKAIVADGTFVLAHYNAASMASLMGENPRVIHELEWLAASTDPAAAKALAQGKTDADLDRAVMHPRVRELVGLPPIDKIPAAELLLERRGVWGADGSWCAGAGVTLTFKKNGTVAIERRWGCDANDDDLDETGKWVVKGGQIVLTSKKVFEGGKTAEIGKCSSDGDGTYCLNVPDAEESSFHRGEHTMH